MKGVKIFEIVLILVFTIFSLVSLFYFLSEKFLVAEERKMVFYSKEDFLFRVVELIYRCFEKFKRENKRIVCYEIEYFGKSEIGRNEIEKKIFNTKFNVSIEFDRVNTNEKIFIIYSVSEVKLVSSGNLIISE